MANIFRLVFLALLLFSDSVFATDGGYWFNGALPGQKFSSLSSLGVAVCATWTSTANASSCSVISTVPPAVLSQGVQGKFTASYTSPYGDTRTNFDYGNWQAVPCVAPLSWDATSNTCKAPVVCSLPQVLSADGQSCISPPCATTNGQVLSSGIYNTSTMRPVTISCFSGCEGIFSGNNVPEIVCGGMGGISVGTCSYVIRGKYIGDGVVCTGNTPPAPIPPPAATPPPATPTPPVVTPPSNLPPAPKLSPADQAAQAAANGAAAAGAAGAAAAAAAAAIGADAPTAAAAGAAASVVAAGAAAGAAAAAATNNPTDFCTQHPKSSICQNPSTLGAGTCSNGSLSGFTCSGDVVQCDIAQKQREHDCFIENQDQNMSDEYSKLKLENDGTLNPSSSGNHTIQSIQSSLDASSSIAGVCPNDKTVTVLGHGVVFPVSNLCPWLSALGYVFLALSYITAARILGSSV